MIFPISHKRKMKLREVNSLFLVYQIKPDLNSNISLMRVFTVTLECVVFIILPLSPLYYILPVVAERFFFKVNQIRSFPSQKPSEGFPLHAD